MKIIVLVSFKAEKRINTELVRSCKHRDSEAMQKKKPWEVPATVTELAMELRNKNDAGQGEIEYFFQFPFQQKEIQIPHQKFNFYSFYEKEKCM